MEGTSNVRDIFLFSCYTGLAYADVEKLKKTDIVTGNDGGQWLISCRQKTDITARIPLLPVALGIINKHAGHPKCVAKNLVLPVLTNQKMNDYLKIIANQCGIIPASYLRFAFSTKTIILITAGILANKRDHPEILLLKRKPVSGITIPVNNWKKLS